jgi:subtilase family serine protease
MFLNKMYFILKDKSNNYLKLDGTTTTKKDEAATYFYNNVDNSIIYEDQEKNKGPYYREQVCNSNCDGKGYCKQGICVGIPLYKSIGIITWVILLIIAIIVMFSIIVFYKRKNKNKRPYIGSEPRYGKDHELQQKLHPLLSEKGDRFFMSLLKDK